MRNHYGLNGIKICPLTTVLLSFLVKHCVHQNSYFRLGMLIDLGGSESILDFVNLISWMPCEVISKQAIRAIIRFRIGYC